MIHRFLVTLNVSTSVGQQVQQLHSAPPLVTVIIPLALIVNLLLVLVNFTQTVNVDIWNTGFSAFRWLLVANVTNIMLANKY